MPLVSQEYQRLVLDDIHTYAGLSHPVRAGLFERLFRSKLPIDSIHPSPDDEFSDPAIGPSGEALDRYLTEWRTRMQRGLKVEVERVCVEKMSTGGYMLLDGHHRWYVAHRIGLEELPVRIMNVTPVTKVVSSVRSSDRKMCVSFDLDEVLLMDSDSPEAANGIPVVFKRLVKKSLRRNAPLLIRELQSMGFAVWVYTDRFVEEQELVRLFRFFHVRVDGIVGGLKNKNSRAMLREAFREKYAVSIHIDNTGIICVDTQTKEYETAEIGGDVNEWGGNALNAVKQIPIVQKYLSK